VPPEHKPIDAAMETRVDWDVQKQNSVGEFEAMMLTPMAPSLPPKPQIDARTLAPSLWTDVCTISNALMPSFADYSVLTGRPVPRLPMDRSYADLWAYLQYCLQQYWNLILRRQNVPKLAKIGMCLGGISSLTTATVVFEHRDPSQKPYHPFDDPQPTRQSDEPSQQELFEMGEEELRGADARLQREMERGPMSEALNNSLMEGCVADAEHMRLRAVVPKNQEAYSAWLQTEGFRLYTGGWQNKFSWEEWCRWTGAVVFEKHYSKGPRPKDADEAALKSTIQKLYQISATPPVTLEQAKRGYNFSLAQVGNAESQQGRAQYHAIVDQAASVARRKARAEGAERFRAPDGNGTGEVVEGGNAP